jgi:hypothetical protein
MICILKPGVWRIASSVLDGLRRLKVTMVGGPRVTVVKDERVTAKELLKLVLVYMSISSVRFVSWSSSGTYLIRRARR